MATEKITGLREAANIAVEWDHNGDVAFAINERIAALEQAEQTTNEEKVKAAHNKWVYVRFVVANDMLLGYQVVNPQGNAIAGGIAHMQPLSRIEPTIEAAWSDAAQRIKDGK